MTFLPALIFAFVPQGKPLVGWDEDFRSIKAWKLIDGGRAVKATRRRGTMKLTLDTVPKGWPFQYQYGGVTRDVKINIGRYHLLRAELGDVKGYAHIDIEILDDKGKVVNGFRSTTITSAGVVSFDFGKKIDNPIYTVRIRLIAGGPNEGASATYNWVRFIDPRIQDDNP